MARDWRSAFFQQARSDYEVFHVLRKEDAPFSHQLHYLQVATEKMSKGFAASVGGPRPPRTHHTFVTFMRIARGMPNLRHACGFQQADPYRAYIDSLLPVAHLIENLAPVGELDRPNPEYPWEQGDEVAVPVEYPFPDLDFKLPRMMKMLNFIDRCFEII
ncbi:MAG: hypothetical protein KY468_09750 [Armatimonadetes bacterium]|nr:hypothetical protein [Armatimonadota bacterium]